MTNSEKVLNYFHLAYSLGALVMPVTCTRMMHQASLPYATDIRRQNVFWLICLVVFHVSRILSYIVHRRLLSSHQTTSYSRATAEIPAHTNKQTFRLETRCNLLYNIIANICFKDLPHTGAGYYLVCH